MRDFLTYSTETLEIWGMADAQRMETIQHICEEEGCGNVAIIDLDLPIEKMRFLRARASSAIGGNKYLVLWQAMRKADGTYAFSGAYLTNVTECGLPFEDERERKTLYEYARFEYTNRIIDINPIPQ